MTTDVHNEKIMYYEPYNIYIDNINIHSNTAALIYKTREAEGGTPKHLPSISNVIKQN